MGPKTRFYVSNSVQHHTSDCSPCNIETRPASNVARGALKNCALSDSLRTIREVNATDPISFEESAATTQSFDPTARAG
jgi:hypothetical protein